MEPSPLTLQARPEVFQPKIVELYDALFRDEDDEKSEGFWREFFLLRPDKASLQRILSELSPDDMLQLQYQSRQLFSRSIARIKSGSAPSDAHALDTLTTFLASVLPKKYTNPSSDIINVLAGLDDVDSVFTEFVSVLDTTIKSGTRLDVRQKAIKVALSVTSGAYQTSLLSYFTHRDLFPALMKFIQDAETPDQCLEPFILLGLLANYNRFEFQNPYRMRLDDFVNEGTIQKIVRSVASTCAKSRSKYVEIQDDLPEGWSFSNTLSMIGLGGIANGAKPAPPVLDPEIAKEMFVQLPGPEASVLLATYDFTNANKLFCFNLVSLPADSKGGEPPISSFLSLTSYHLQHAHSSMRTSYYSHLDLLIVRLLVEDPVLCRRMCSAESRTTVRLCRQRQPFLPLVRGERVLACSVMDVMIDALSHNLRRRLDIDLYVLAVGVLLRLVASLARSRTRLAYHWDRLFYGLLSLVRFCATYHADLRRLPNIDTLLDDLVNLIALSLSAGEHFLPTPAAYDNLIHEVVANGEVLWKFRDNFGLLAREGGDTSGGGGANGSSIVSLTSVVDHYMGLVDDKTGKKKGGHRSGKHVTSEQIVEMIRQGYETLSIPAREGLDAWKKYREADERAWLKKMARVVVADVKDLVRNEVGFEPEKA